ncbi:MAG TPA: DUF4342 domain-containing protein [Trueperaceae bacterium]|nr:DUF4342 domain-containing protein [Trueperaceae bacterium]
MTDQPQDTQGQEPRRQYTEEFRVSGERVLAKVKELVHEGNVRRITIKNDDGKTLIEIPLTLGVIGTVLLPVWAAIGAIAALAANLTIAVDRVDGPVQGDATEPPATPDAATTRATDQQTTAGQAPTGVTARTDEF